MSAGSSDWRRLGVCVHGVSLDGLALPLAALGVEGWFGCESDPSGACWRWTDGAARLPSGPAIIAVTLGHSALYRVEHAAPALQVA